MKTLDMVRSLLERLLILWLVLLSLLAYRWPLWWPVEQGVFSGFDPFVQSASWLKYLFAVTMLAIGSLLPADEVRQVFRRWPTVLGGTMVQYTAMPLLAYGVGRAFGFAGPVMIGIVMVGCVPG